jgi:hypothetical protein
LPSLLKLDTDKIRGLLLKVTGAVLPVWARIDDESVSEECRELATASIALMEVVGAVVETAILPMAGSIKADAGPATTQLSMAVAGDS